MKNKNALYYQKISEEQILKVMEDIVKKEINFFIWNPNKPEQKKEFYPLLLLPEQKTVIIHYINSPFEKSIHPLANKEIIFDISLKNAHLMGKTRLYFEDNQNVHYIKLDEGEYFVGKTRPFTKTVTRKTEKFNLFLKIDDKTFKLVELSMGGLVFLFPEKEKENIRTGDVILKSTIIFDEYVIIIPKAIIIQFLLPSKSEDSRFIRVALRYLSLDLDTEKKLTQLIEIINI